MAKHEYTNFPPELRNLIAEYVLESEDLVVDIDKNGVAKQSHHHLLGLKQTSKTIHTETKRFAAPLRRIIFKPMLETSKYGNDTINAFFNMELWISGMPPHRLANLQDVTLHLGKIDVVKLPCNNSWYQEVRRIVDCIDVEPIMRSKFDFTITVDIVAGPAPVHRLVIPLEDLQKNAAYSKFGRDLETFMATPKKMLSSFVAEEWKMLTQPVGSTKRRELYCSLVAAERRLRDLVTCLYWARDAVREKRPRFPGKRESRILSGHWAPTW